MPCRKSKPDRATACVGRFSASDRLRVCKSCERYLLHAAHLDGRLGHCPEYSLPSECRRLRRQPQS